MVLKINKNKLQNLIEDTYRNYLFNIEKIIDYTPPKYDPNWNKKFKQVDKSTWIPDKKKGHFKFSFKKNNLLKLDNNVISYHLGFVCDSTFYYYKPTYDIKYHNYSPGKIHISKLIEFSIKTKLKTFDFLLGNEKYKENWISDIKYTKSYYIKGPGFYSNFGIWWFRKGKNIFKRIINYFKTFKNLGK